uniref:C-type lectin domain-containing protein n=1 Tax=Ursus maritimus TaxID=29073 RepID=A0A452T6U7_URSMA
MNTNPSSFTMTYHFSYGKTDKRLSELHTYHSSLTCFSEGTSVAGKVLQCPTRLPLFSERDQGRFISTAQSFWSKSQQNCVVMGAHLVAINTEAEQVLYFLFLYDIYSSLAYIKSFFHFFSVLIFYWSPLGLCPARWAPGRAPMRRPWPHSPGSGTMEFEGAGLAFPGSAWFIPIGAQVGTKSPSFPHFCKPSCIWRSIHWPMLDLIVSLPGFQPVGQISQCSSMYWKTWSI